MKKVVLILVAASCMQYAVGQKPNSKFGGVQIGAITYSYQSMSDQSLDAVLGYVLQSGINSVELLGVTVENYAGIPKDRDEARQWRTSVSMDKFKEIRKIFQKNGINIHILNCYDLPVWTDEEIDYAFNVCKALGAKGITMEISEEAAKRLAPFTDKHKLCVLFHNHGQPGNPDFSFDRALAYGQRLMLNFDAGHYYGATGQNPCEVIRRLNKRIFSVHLKDKTGPQDTPGDTNVSFGDGKTPLVEMLQLIRKEKWPIYCDIELEYSIPQDSDAVKEVIKCVNYCKVALEEKK